MRVVFVVRSVAHLTYCDSAIRHLCQRGHDVHLLFDAQWSRGFSDQALEALLRTTDRLTTGWSLRRSNFWRKPLFACREILSYASYLRRPEQSSFYLQRWGKFLPEFLKKRLQGRVVNRLLASQSVQYCLQRFEHVVPPDPAIRQWLCQEKPDVLVATPVNMRFSEEVEYLKAAKALGIPTVIPVLSWDNLTTKGLFHVVPDLTLVWNAAQEKEAIEVHGIPRRRVLVIGSLFFDKWFQPVPWRQDRDSFCRKVGLDPRRPFVAYLGSSRNIAVDETWLVRELIDALRQSGSEVLEKTQVLVRPHPANARIYEQLPPSLVTVWPRQGALPDTDELCEDFFETLRHAAVAAGINTSAMIDAIIADRPCLALMPPRYQKTQQQAVHFQHLLRANVIDTMPTAAECAAVIADVLRGKDARRGERQRFVGKFVRPRGMTRSAGELAAAAIEMLARGKTPEQIDRALDQPKEWSEAA